MSNDLPQRMREAASVLTEATARSRKATGSQAGEATGSSMEFWCEQDMLEFADQWEAQDCATYERTATAAALADELLKAQRLAYPSREDLHSSSKAAENALILAWHLVDEGWRKGDTE